MSTKDDFQLPPVDPSVDEHGADVQEHLQPFQQQQAAPAPMQPTDPQGVSVPAVAEDVDLIEKEWVEKAKQIVNNTNGDPHSQSQKINQMKADYIKKRYNKDIKSEE